MQHTESLYITDQPPKPCPHCGTLVIPAQAGAVRINQTGRLYFCSAQCAQAHRTPLAQPVSADATSLYPVDPVDEATPRLEGRDKGLSPWTIALAILSATISWFAEPPALRYLAAALLGCSAVLLIITAQRQLLWAPPLMRLMEPLLCLAGALLCFFPAYRDAWTISAWSVIVVIVTLRFRLLSRESTKLSQTLAEVNALIPKRAKVIEREYSPNPASVTKIVGSDDIRAGDIVILSAGDTAPVDGRIVSGKAKYAPHPYADGTLLASEGSWIMCGASIIEGSVHLLATCVGAHSSLRTPTLIRATNEAAAKHPLRRLEPFVPWLVCASVILIWMQHWEHPKTALTLSLGCFFSVSWWGLFTLGRWPLMTACAEGIKRGFIFRSQSSLQLAGQIDTLFVSANTVYDEDGMRLSEIVSADNFPAEQALALSVALEKRTGSTHPIAKALYDYAHEHAVQPGVIARAEHVPGLGIKGQAEDESEVLLGNRRLMLEQGVAVARFEEQARLREKEGASIVFLAKGQQALALFVVNTPLMAGSRTAVQNLRDIGINSILLSGDHFDSAAALAQQVDITEVKSDLGSYERSQQLRALNELKEDVALVAYSRSDESALREAPLAIRLADIGGIQRQRSMAIASDDLRDAAEALWLARGHLRRTNRGKALVMGSAFITLCGVVVGWFALPWVAAITLICDFLVFPTASRLQRAIRQRMPRPA